MRGGAALTAALVLAVALAPTPGALADNPLGPGQHARPPILVLNDAVLGVGCVPNLAAGVVSGCGTAASPYVIEGWRIEPNVAYSVLEGTTAIEIRETTRHLVIRGNALTTGFTHSIRLENAQNVRIENNVLIGDVVISVSGNIVAIGNSVSGADEGFNVGSGPTRIIANSVTGSTGVGIGVAASNVEVSSNSVSYGGSNGITFGGSYSNVSITHNLVTNNSGVGIYDFGMGANVSDNVISYNVGGGLNAGDHWSTYSGNNIFGNGAYGARASDSIAVDLRNNWWGHSSGPSGLGSGSGDALIKGSSAAMPLWDPWLTSENPDAGP